MSYPDTVALLDAYREVRALSENLCTPLAVDDFQIQSIPQTSPPKWHLGHVTWFFETFVLGEFMPGYRPLDARYDYLFNSYYYTHGRMHPRPRRGLLSRPTVAEVMDWRRHVDEAMVKLMTDLPATQIADLSARITLGLHHEQQHQELLLMDIKHNFSVNPLQPVYRNDLDVTSRPSRPLRWVDGADGIVEIGHAGGGFAFDNETPRHAVLLRPHQLADRLVTNGEYLDFIQDAGYSDPRLWLADGWAQIQEQGWRHPLYWSEETGEWSVFTLGGLRTLDRHEPVAHLSYYEADAYARWAGCRLPLEAEIESRLQGLPVSGNFLDANRLHPAAAGEAGQWYGDLWTWTATPYTAYPGFRPLDGSLGEYNGKFMSSQMVLRGGSCLTPAGHTRASYRNFFYPAERWAATGLRLVREHGG